MAIRLAVAFVIGAILGLALGIGYNRHELSELVSKPTSLRTDAPYVDLALKLWAAKTHESPESSMEGKYPRAMHFPTEVCIELGMQTGGAGGAPIYCFDRKTHELTRKFDDVE
jgi:hypothetical protein